MKKEPLILTATVAMTLLLVFGLLEASLRVFDYGEDLALFIPTTPGAT